MTENSKGSEEEARRIDKEYLVDLKEKATLLLNLPENCHIRGLVKSRLGYSKIEPRSCEAIWGVKHGALYKWMHEVPKTGVNRSSFVRLADQINELYRDSSDLNGRIPTNTNFVFESNKYEFGELLGLQWRDTRKILDEYLYVKSQATSLLAMPNEDIDLLDSIKGVCIAWHITPTILNGKTECRLVRSFIDVCDPVTYNEEKSIYRCRWRLPYVKKNKSNKNITHYHYLGSVSYADESETFTWLFEPKNKQAVEKSPDFPYVLTQEVIDKDEFHIGSYISKNQDKLIYTSSFAICKVNEEVLAKLGVENTPHGLLAYERFYTDIITNGVFSSLADAKQQACCKNERLLLEKFEPSCDFLNRAAGDSQPLRSRLVLS